MRGLNVRCCLRAFRRSFSSQAFEAKNDPNHLKAFIRDRIRSTGPITVAEFMSLSVRSAAGYYPQQASKVLITYFYYDIG